MIAVNLNPVLKNYLIDAGYRDIEIYPINAYSSSTAPFITWIELPTIHDNEQYWMYESNITYSIYDNDLSRAKDISRSLETFFNIGDNVEDIKSLMNEDNLYYRLLWLRLVNGGMFMPAEREGYASIVRVFQAGYVSL